MFSFCLSSIFNWSKSLKLSYYSYSVSTKSYSSSFLRISNPSLSIMMTKIWSTYKLTDSEMYSVSRSYHVLLVRYQFFTVDENAIKRAKIFDEKIVIIFFDYSMELGYAQVLFRLRLDSSHFAMLNRNSFLKSLKLLV